MKFRDLLEAKRTREEYTGVAATDKYKEIEGTSNKKVQSFVDYDGKEVQSILTKTTLFHVYFDYEDVPMFIIENPNNKDVRNLKASLEAE